MSSATLVPVAFALLAALCFALGALLTKKGLRYTDSITGTLISIGASTACYWLVSPFSLHWADWQPAAVAIFALVGCFRPILSANLANAGHHRLGPTISSTVASVSPLFAVLGGVLVLGEHLEPGVAAGTLAIVAGVGVLSWSSGGTGRWLRWALLLPLGAALLRAAAHVAAKGALDLVSSPVLGGLVGYTVSLGIGLALFLVRRPARRTPIGTGALGWFTCSGIANGMGILALYTALEHGQVVLVTPVTSAAPLFTLVLSRLFFHVEVINRRTLAGVLLIVPGVMLVSLYH
ncbi:MAG TPA: EamA family transporter [bacterium]|nr:EamA family transporter [bacterium]